MPIPDYFNRVNPDLLAFIPPDAKVILEIGCGAGALAEAYRRVNPGVYWCGVDNNEEALQIARQPDRCTWALFGHAEIFRAREYLQPDTRYDKPDCLILGDILEHLKDPWVLLKDLTWDLSPGAQILASIPNIQHFSVLYNLLFGHFTYADEGVMDRAHLRWFTLEGIREMFDQAGLEIFEVRGIRSPADEEGWKLWSEFIAPLNIDLRQTAPLQYLVRAVNPPAQIDHLHIHAVTAEPCCARPRIHEPFQALATIPGVKCTTESVFSGPFFLRNRDEPLIWIQQRDRSFSEKHQRGILDLGAIIIAELDDDPAGLQGYPEHDYIQLRAVHAVQVSTERLAETVREFNPNVMVFENQIADLPPDHGPIIDYQTSIFYGAQNRQEDWASIMPALNRILAEHPKDIEVQVVCDQQFFDALETTEKTFHQFLPYNEYRQLLGSCDIALLPLEPSRFNEHKSDIKFLECAAEGVAVVAGHVVYGNTIKIMPNLHDLSCPEWGPCLGYTYFVPAQFETYLRVLINEPQIRHTFATHAYAYVRDHRLLGQHFRKRLEAYQALLQSKADLDRQLFERVPALRPAQPALSESLP